MKKYDFLPVSFEFLFSEEVGMNFVNIDEGITLKHNKKSYGYSHKLLT